MTGSFRLKSDGSTRTQTADMNYNPPAADVACHTRRTPPRRIVGGEWLALAIPLH
jgi:hypothetical protein